MRKETAAIAEAFARGDKLRMSRTMTDGESVYLHGHEVFKRIEPGYYAFNLCGWNTKTTRERVNGIIETLARVKDAPRLGRVRVFVRDGDAFMSEPNGGEVAIDDNRWHVLDATE